MTIYKNFRFTIHCICLGKWKNKGQKNSYFRYCPSIAKFAVAFKLKNYFANLMCIYIHICMFI